jgi:two-component system chemotaxis response regulator CheY
MKVDPNMLVLIVDDYRTMVGIMRKLLQQIGYENVHAASNAEEALEKIRTNKYSLIISDWHVKPATGHDLLQRIHAEEAAGNRTPFLFVMAESGKRRKASVNGADLSSYLVKPFSAAILKQKIESIFGVKGEAPGPAPKSTTPRRSLS